MQSVWAVVFLAVSVMAPLLGAEKANIVLSDGTVLKAARIVSIGKTSVAIVFEGGVASVSPEDLPLDVLARAHMERPSPTGVTARLGEPEKVTAVETPGPLSLQAPRDPVSSETYIPEKASGSKVESESAAGGKPSSDVHRTQGKESGGTIQKAVGAAIDWPTTVILVLSSVLCCALVLAYHGSDSGPITDIRHLTCVVFGFGCASLVLGLFCVYQWERPPPPPAPETFGTGGIQDPMHAAAVAELTEIKRKAAAAYIGALDAKRGVSASTEEMKKAGLSDGEIRAYRAYNSP